MIYIQPLKISRNYFKGVQKMKKELIQHELLNLGEKQEKPAALQPPHISSQISHPSSVYLISTPGVCFQENKTPLPPALSQEQYISRRGESPSFLIPSLLGVSKAKLQISVAKSLEAPLVHSVQSGRKWALSQVQQLENPVVLIALIQAHLGSFHVERGKPNPDYYPCQGHPHKMGVSL